MIELVTIVEISLPEGHLGPSPFEIDAMWYVLGLVVLVVDTFLTHHVEVAYYEYKFHLRYFIKSLLS